MNEEMTLNEYQRQAGTTAIYPGKGTQAGLNYALMGLGGEVGEIQNKFQKILRGDRHLDPQVKADLAEEAGGVLWFLAAVATELGFTLDDIASTNLQKLASRKARGKIMGDGDDR